MSGERDESLKFKQILLKKEKKETEFVVDFYTIFFVLSGEAKMKSDNIIYRLSEQSCIVVTPYSPICLSEIKECTPLHYYQLSFQVENSQQTSLLGEHKNLHPLKLLEKIERMYELSRDEKSGILSVIEENMIFFELLYFICKGKETGMKQKDTKEKIQESIHYIHTHYHDELTREYLAQMAGFSPGYYSHAFKKVIGSSPIDYVNEVRIAKAKELLISSQHRLKTVAKSVGFQDEFYFSRLFKKTTGISPTHYVKKSRTRILNADISFQGHFRALDIIPFATLDYDCEQGYRLRVGTNPTKHDTIPSMEGMLESLIEIKPDVILCADYDDEKVKLLQKVAPTVVIPWMKHDWREHFMQIGDLFGRKKETEKWLADYDTKAEVASTLVKEKVSIEDRIMIVRIYNERLTVYGKRNIGNIFYNDLKLKPVDIVAEIPTVQNQYPITFAQLISYKPDYLFIMDSSDSQSQWLLESITTNEEWYNIPAVRKNQVHFISKSWLDYSPTSHLEHLEEAVGLLRT
ncbi:AraC family transcriptional regulator [Bacillus sp. DJP31]|uniref:AraC family transcriptional regulator n=1 Tax=Bacillus sp. DJP31 TaxID=3409789 RepID=UPI003BB4FC4F